MKSLSWLLLRSACLATACNQKSKPASESAGATASGLTICVVDDPPMAAAIGALRAEWKARTGSSLSVVQSSWSGAIGESLNVQADAIIFASRHLGSLVAQGTIAPLPADYATNQALAWSDTFELQQVAETRWAGVPYAVTFGSPVFTCLCRRDLLEKSGRKAPETWSEYQELAELFARMAPERASDTWHAVAEPLAAGFAGRLLLARAAAYAKHRDHYSDLFHIETLTPLIDGEPFVRAMEDLAAAAKLAPANKLEMTVEDVRREFWLGRCGLALCWPGRGELDPINTAGIAVSFVEIPGAKKVYNIANKNWEDRPTDAHRVPLLAASGRLGALLKSSSHPRETLSLFAWLSGPEWAAKTSAASSSTTIYRRSQVKFPQPWLESGIDSEAKREYAVSVQAAMSRTAYLMAPRLPGQKEYLDALDVAVHQVVSGDTSAKDALVAVAAKWRAINEQVGIDQQRRLYRDSLGLTP